MEWGRVDALRALGYVEWGRVDALRALGYVEWGRVDALHELAAKAERPLRPADRVVKIV